MAIYRLYHLSDTRMLSRNIKRIHPVGKRWLHSARFAQRVMSGYPIHLVARACVSKQEARICGGPIRKNAEA